jgi:hypothetical protein
MAVPLDTQAEAAAWIVKHVRPMIANLASSGHVDGVQALRLMEGVEGIQATLAWLQSNLPAIRAATGGR